MPAAAVAPDLTTAPSLASTEPSPPAVADTLGVLLLPSGSTEAAGQTGELLQQLAVAKLQQKTRRLAREAAADVEGVECAFLLWDGAARHAVLTMTGTSREGSLYRDVARALVRLQAQLRPDAISVEGGYVPDELPGEDAVIVFRR